ncbi:type III-B CRISPR module-associated Cmr3 family protein [Donghicola mangrovi]|uniref:Type III-B CRISPR module-associated protein Cmr3 n=1 Tax=Donghicola mangrovi TaxID=2729614 RepID=A0A850Q5C7_9RHOB|nr:type III-B CRISPR module-associated Cmr3 family protein [Donghicola mangrovi]NVO23312.1 hypothetical protein [Donghicola mangrovi]
MALLLQLQTKGRGMMTERSFRFDANDTLMFRDGAPFNQADDGAAQARSVFPPNSSTLIGALRLKLAQNLGFPEQAWPSNFLGDGVNWQSEKSVLGSLQFSPILLSRRNEGQTSVLLPCPLSVVNVQSESGIQPALLSPSDETFETDIGAVRLPAVSSAMRFGKVKQLSQSFVELDDFSRILNGLPPKNPVAANKLWSNEVRTGIGIDETSRHTRDGELYFASHIRLHDDVSLDFSVTGLGCDEIASCSLPVGGEHRMMHLSNSEISFASVLKTIQEAQSDDAGRRGYCAIALSPMLLKKTIVPGTSLHPELSGTLVSACVGTAEWAGGWDSLSRRPIPMVQLLPAGTVLFFEKALGIETPKQGSIIKVGAATEWGLGHMIIGNWRKNT